MRRIYFVPEKRGQVYVASPQKNGCYMDTVILDTHGLVREIQLTLGIIREVPSFNERLIEYFKVVREWLAQNEENVMRKSFELSPLTTTRRLLLWRDELKMAQWNFHCEDSSSRLGAIAGVEKKGVGGSLADSMISLVARLKNESGSPLEDFEIIIPMEKKFLRPIVAELLEAAEKAGATVAVNSHAPRQNGNLGKVRELLQHGEMKKIKLDEADDSLRIFRFDSDFLQSEYLAVMRGNLELELIIDPDSKVTDNRLSGLNMPTSGSSFVSRSRILNLLTLALDLYAESPDIHKFVEWLSAPMHPLPGRFRYSLAEAMASAGGYKNEKCIDVVNKYLEGAFEYIEKGETELTGEEINKLRARREQERKENLTLYLPFLEDENINAENARATLEGLAKWARGLINRLENTEEGQALGLQLRALADSVDILFLLSAGVAEKFSLRLASEWVHEIPVEVTMPQYPALVGSVFSVECPWDIVGESPSTLWAGMIAGDNAPFDCDFLLPGERNAIEKDCRFWERENESNYRFKCNLMPFLFTTDRLTLAYYEKKDGEKTVPHPIITRLMQSVENIEAITSSPDTEKLKTEVVEPVVNGCRKTEYRFANSEKISLPSKMSATSLESLVCYPFDFLFERILNIRSAGIASLPPLSTTKGNVAHGVIASLFSPRDGKPYSTPKEIKQRYEEEFEDRLMQEANRVGAIFLLPENKLELSNFRHQLKQCIENLLTIIDSNRLKVTGCELHFEKFMNFTGEGASDIPDMHGYLDMKLSLPSGKAVVIDLKWTTSKNYHSSLLESNRSVQLEVYSHIVPEGPGNTVTAYFCMPAGRLYTCGGLEGRYVTVIKKENSDDIMTCLINSFRYRSRQLQNGIVEEGDDLPLEDILYWTSSEKEGLFPLPSDDGEVKAANKFSNYRLFKGEDIK